MPSDSTISMNHIKIRYVQLQFTGEKRNLKLNNY